MRPEVALYFALAGSLLALSGSLSDNVFLAGIPFPLGLAVAIAVVWGAKKNRSNNPLAWTFLATSILMFGLIEEWVWLSVKVMGPEVAQPAGSLFSFVGVIFTSTSMVMLFRSRKIKFRLSTMLDSLLLMGVASATLLSLIYREHTSVEQQTLVIIVTIELGLFALIFRMATSGSRFPSFYYCVGSVLLTLVGTLCAAIAPGALFLRPFEEWAWTSSLALMGSAALHPSMSRLSEPTQSSNVPLGRNQIILLSLAIITGPTVTIIGHVRDASLDVFGAVVSIVLALLAVGRFATLVLERDRAQSAMINSQSRLHALISNSVDAIYVVDENGMITYASPSFEHLFGVAAEDLTNESIEEWFRTGSYSKVKESLTKILNGDSSHEQVEMLIRRANDEEIWVVFRMHDARDDEAIRGVIFNVSDITWRKRAEAELQNRVSQQEALAELARKGLQGGQIQDTLIEAVQTIQTTLSAPLVAIWEVNSTRDLVTLRSSAGEVNGLESAAEEEANQYSPEGRTLLSGHSVHFDQLSESNFSEDSFALSHGFSSATCVLIDGAGGAYGVLVAYGNQETFTEEGEISFMESVANVIAVVLGRVNSEHELQQSQKLESVGRLAAGIAHEINTPIQFVGDNLHFLSDAFNELIEAAKGNGDVDLEYLAEEVPVAAAQSLDGVQRVATIVRAMKAFGHPDATEMKMNDVNEALRNTLVVARNEIKYVADVNANFAEIPLVKCHIGELNQVFLNLLVNASHAIGDKIKQDSTSRGQIMVRTWREKNDVVIAIGDSGGGIPPEIRHRIFDPFFTTKDVGRGTGQGLALAKTVIAKHGGTIHFDTDSSGTIFCIKLPIGEQSQAMVAS